MSNLSIWNNPASAFEVFVSSEFCQIWYQTYRRALGPCRLALLDFPGSVFRVYPIRFGPRISLCLEFRYSRRVRTDRKWGSMRSFRIRPRRRRMRLRPRLSRRKFLSDTTILWNILRKLFKFNMCIPIYNIHLVSEEEGGGRALLVQKTEWFFRKFLMNTPRTARIIRKYSSKLSWKTVHFEILGLLGENFEFTLTPVSLELTFLVGFLREL